jgi:hypothetical protein
MPFRNNFVVICLLSLLVIWIYFTLYKWNKDYRYLSGVFLFFIPAYAGLLCWGKYFTRVALTVLVLMSVYTNFAQAFSLKAGYLPHVAAYVKDHGGRSLINIPLSLGIAARTMRLESTEYFALENATDNGEYNDWNRQFYFNMLNIQGAKFQSPADSSMVRKQVLSVNNNTLYTYVPKEQRNSEYILYRDEAYPIYYMFKFTKDANNLIIKRIAHYGKMDGDVKIWVEQEANGERKGNWYDYVLNQDISVVIDGKLKVSVAARIVHAKGHYPIAYRQVFAGDIAENWWDAPLIPLRKDADQTSMTVSF